MIYGIEKKLISEDFLAYLIKSGCLPAYFYKQKNSQSYKEKEIFQKYRSIIRSEEIRNQIDILSESEKHDQSKSFLRINKKTQELSFKSLISPINNISLNRSIYESGKDQMIRNYKFYFRHSKLHLNSRILSSRDHNLLRKTLIWLDWFYWEKGRFYPRNSSYCLSNDAKEIYLFEGLEGLYNIAKKGQKRNLRKYIKKLEDAPYQKDLLLFSCMDLGYLLTKKIKNKTKLINLYRAIAAFDIKHKKLKEARYYSSEFLNFTSPYNNTDILNLLRSIGYERLNHLRILHQENNIFLNDFNFYDTLFKNFHEYKKA